MYCYCPEICLESHPSHPLLFDIDFTNKTAKCLYQLVNLNHPPHKKEYQSFVDTHNKLFAWDKDLIKIIDTDAFFKYQWIEVPSFNIRSHSHPSPESIFSTEPYKPKRSTSNPGLLPQRSKDPLALQLSRLFPEDSVEYRETLAFAKLKESSRDIALKLAQVDILTPRSLSIAIQSLEGVLFYPVRMSQIDIITKMIDSVISPHFTVFIENNQVTREFYTYVQKAIMQAMSNIYNASKCQYDAYSFERLVEYFDGSKERALNGYYEARLTVARIGLSKLLSLFDPDYPMFTEGLKEDTVKALTLFKKCLEKSLEQLKSDYNHLLSLTVASGILQLKIKDNQFKPESACELIEYAQKLEAVFNHPCVAYCLNMTGSDKIVHSFNQLNISIHEFKSLRQIMNDFYQNHSSKIQKFNADNLFTEIKSYLSSSTNTGTLKHLKQPEWIKLGLNDQDYWLVIGVANLLENHLNTHDWSKTLKNLNLTANTIWDLIKQSIDKYQKRDVLNPTGNFSI